MKISTLTQKSAHWTKLFLIVFIGALQLQTTAVSAANTTTKANYFLETNRVWINVTSTQGAFSQTLFGYRTGATPGFDQGLDGAYWNDGAVALASLIGDVRYAIQFKGLPFSVSDVVPLSFSATAAGTYTFAIDHMDGFFNNQTMAVYIHDTQTGTYTNLKTGGYTFSSAMGSFNNRFQLTYSAISTSLATVTNDFTSSNLEVYHHNNSVVIKSGNTMLQNVAVFNLNGQLLYENNAVNANETSISNLNICQQTIIIRAIAQDGRTATKKWLFL